MSSFSIPFCSMASIAKKHKKKNKTLVQWFEKRSLQELSDFFGKKSLCTRFFGKKLMVMAFSKKRAYIDDFYEKGGKVWNTR